MSSMYTPIEQIPKIRDAARHAFFSGKATSLQFRREQLAQIGYMLKDNEDRFKEAVTQDLGRHALETELFEFGPVFKEIRIAYDNLEKWCRPQSIDFNMSFFLMGPKMKPEPKGVVLIIAAFNLPIFLTMMPLVGAIAAGNAVVIKPSEKTPASSALLAELLPQYLDPELYHVVNGGIPETTKILELRWDQITYIGGPAVGRIVAAAAAKHLTPVALELGGKNPVVLDPNVDIKFAAKRLLWGRFVNAGQLCTCPDYLLVPREILEPLIAAMKETYASFYPDGPAKSDSFGRIISEEHTLRIKGLLDNTKGTIILGGEVDVSKKYVAPTVVSGVDGSDSLMQEETFGPVLMLVPVKDVDEAIAFIRAREHPLSVYVFSPDKKFQQKVFANTKSGAAVANDTHIPPAVPGFTIGGVGNSGYGYYAGKQGFDQCSHLRATLDSPSWVDTFVLGFRYPPYQTGYKKFLNLMYPSLPPRPKRSSAAASSTKGWAFWLVTVLVGAASVWLIKSRAHLQLIA